MGDGEGDVAGGQGMGGSQSEAGGDVVVLGEGDGRVGSDGGGGGPREEVGQGGRARIVGSVGSGLAALVAFAGFGVLGGGGGSLAKSLAGEEWEKSTPFAGSSRWRLLLRRLMSTRWRMGERRERGREGRRCSDGSTTTTCSCSEGAQREEEGGGGAPTAGCVPRHRWARQVGERDGRHGCG